MHSMHYIKVFASKFYYRKENFSYDIYRYNVHTFSGAGSSLRVTYLPMLQFFKSTRHFYCTVANGTNPRIIHH